MNITVRQIADWVGGEVIGDPSTAISGAAPLGEARPNDLSFLESDKYLAAARASRAEVLLCGRGVTIEGKTLIRVAEPLSAFIDVITRIMPPTPPPPRGIDPSARVHPTAQIAPDASIEAFVTVGPDCVIGPRCHLQSGVSVGRDCRLGADVVLYPNAVIYHGCVLGDRVIIHANAVIGADGFGYRTRDGQHIKVPQLGFVELGDDVEIGACATVDRGTFGPTRIGAGTKIDNHVQIGHNCQIGRGNLFAAHVAIAGSCKTGNYVLFGGQAGAADHLTIGDGAVILAQGGVTKDIPPGEKVWGTPARPRGSYLRMLASLEHVPEMLREWRRQREATAPKDDREAA